MNISNLEKDFMQLSVDIGNSMGLDSLSSNIIAMLYLESEPISMEELSEKTGYSKTSIYNKLKTFENMCMIKKIKKAGSKKALFYIEKNIPQILNKKIEVMHQKKLLPLKERIPKIIEKYQNKKLNKEEERKLEILKSYNKQINIMEKKIKKILEIFENE
jgi:DNA-binding transcriptional regulator GbsR (MarR family)